MRAGNPHLMMPATKPNQNRETMKVENQANQALLETIADIPATSAWQRGVNLYALELVEQAETQLTLANLRETFLNGAQDWGQYSYGGCALIYDADIAERLCSPSELRRKKNGELQPSPRETWLDCQARALWQAEAMIKRALRRAELVAA
jgi:hypothetical protein